MANRPFVLNKSSFYIGFWLFACTCTIRPVFLFFHEQYTIAMSFCTRVLVGVRSTTHDVPNCKPVSGALNHGADSAPKEFTVRARSAHALLHEAQIPAKQKRYCFLLSRPASRPSGNFAAVARPAKNKNGSRSIFSFSHSTNLRDATVTGSQEPWWHI